MEKGSGIRAGWRVLALIVLVLSFGGITAQETERAALEKQVEEAETAHKAAYERYMTLRRKLLEVQHKESPYSGELERAKKQFADESDFSTSRIFMLGDTAEIGDLKVTLESFGTAKRKLQRDNFMGDPTKVELDLWGALIRVENVSEGRIVSPFGRSGSWLARMWVIDSWDNRITGASMGDVAPQDDAGFVLSGADVLPGKTETYLLGINDLQVLSFDYLTVKLEVTPSNKGGTEHVFFLVPKDKVEGID